jgi:hypothetical protein
MRLPHPLIRFLVKYIFLIDRWGIARMRKGDEIVWIWPWRRKPYKIWGFTMGSGVWLSINCGGFFSTLQQLDNFWEEYRKACIIRWEQEMQEYLKHE